MGLTLTPRLTIQEQKANKNRIGFMLTTLISVALTAMLKIALSKRRLGYGRWLHVLTHKLQGGPSRVEETAERASASQSLLRTGAILLPNGAARARAFPAAGRTPGISTGAEESSGWL